MSHTIRMSFNDDDYALVLLAARDGRASAYCRRVVLADAGKHRKRLSKTATDVLRTEVCAILQEIGYLVPPIWGNAKRGSASAVGAVDNTVSEDA